MNLRKVAILTLVVLLPLSLCAQKRKKRVVKKEPVIEIPQEDPRITNMREMTQQIIIMEILRNITVIHNGRTLKYTEESEIVVDGETVRHFTLDYKVESGYSYAQVKDNRLYFVLDDKWTDITDVCGEDKYFRYEEKGDDGSKFILYIGGTVSDHGVMQVLLDADGNCVSVISNNDVLPKWAEKALKDDKIEPNFVMTGTGGNFL